jgi:hypothetical protein
MEPWVFPAVLYISSVFFAAYMTVREQRHAAQPTGMYGAIGLLACAVWPLIAVACLFTKRPAV